MTRNAYRTPLTKRSHSLSRLWIPLPLEELSKKKNLDGWKGPAPQWPQGLVSVCVARGLGHAWSASDDSSGRKSANNVYSAPMRTNLATCHIRRRGIPWVNGLSLHPYTVIPFIGLGRSWYAFTEDSIRFRNSNSDNICVPAKKVHLACLNVIREGTLSW